MVNKSTIDLGTLTRSVVLGGAANARCPQCGHAVAFFSGKKRAFISDVKTFASDRRIRLRCPIHGTFKVRAGDFCNRLERL